ncbi:hypothetical protein DOA17_03070 [Salmonella enterica subsp. enterica serovar Virchow]|nr:hypothetical protein [Salmonella enterica subsp. enterica serovar Virchow]
MRIFTIQFQKAAIRPKTGNMAHGWKAVYVNVPLKTGFRITTEVCVRNMATIFVQLSTALVFTAAKSTI